VLEAYDFSGVRTIMDVGGGNGSLVLAVLGRYPELQGRIADLPYIEAQARGGIEAAGAAGRCAFSPCDFFREIPKGADLVVMKSVLHDWTDEECVRILKNCRAAIEPGGRLLIIEAPVPEDLGPEIILMMDLNMLVMTGGRERTVKEYEALFQAAGFRLSRVVLTKSPFALLEALPA